MDFDSFNTKSYLLYQTGPYCIHLNHTGDLKAWWLCEIYNMISTHTIIQRSYRTIQLNMSMVHNRKYMEDSGIVLLLKKVWNLHMVCLLAIMANGTTHIDHINHMIATIHTLLQIYIELLPLVWHWDSHKSICSIICCLTLLTASGLLQFLEFPAL